MEKVPVAAESIVNVLKSALYFKASARLLAKTSAATVVLDGGAVLITVGTAVLIFPVGFTDVDEYGNLEIIEKLEEGPETVELGSPAEPPLRLDDAVDKAEEADTALEDTDAVLAVTFGTVTKVGVVLLADADLRLELDAVLGVEATLDAVADDVKGSSIELAKDRDEEPSPVLGDEEATEDALAVVGDN
ncbi:hypothetical protein SUNI508_13450 [Seiridium unicorne]|uniref:Uncharacterized protein n=1 Tax=Seiridium unicorne TaxID=138068 RepID=A0ABR2VD24_9PEZI